MVDRKGRKVRPLEELDLQDALLIGAGQAVALLPGVSRSGATIGTGLLLGLTREASARFSFLLSTPVIAGAVALKGVHLAKSGLPPGEGAHFAIGILASAVSGYAAISFLMKWVRTRPYTEFVIYRLALAAVIVGVWLLRNAVRG